MRLTPTDFKNPALNFAVQEYKSAMPTAEVLRNTPLDPSISLGPVDLGLTDKELRKYLAEVSLKNVLVQQQYLVFGIGTRLGFLTDFVPIATTALQAFEVILGTLDDEDVSDFVKINTAIGQAGQVLSAIPTIYTQIAGTIIALGTQLANLFRGLEQTAWPKEILPMQGYDAETDDWQFNNTIRNRMNASKDWTEIFLPRFQGALSAQVRVHGDGKKGLGWALGDGAIPAPRKGGFTKQGEFDPVAGALGFIPGGRRILSVFQTTFTEKPKCTKNHKGEEVCELPIYDPRGGSIGKATGHDVGAFYPATAQGAMSLWDFLSQRGTAMYTVNCDQSLARWSAYFDALWEGILAAWNVDNFRNGWGRGAWENTIQELAANYTGPETGGPGGWIPYSAASFKPLGTSDRNAWEKTNLLHEIIRPALENLITLQGWHLANTVIAAYLPIVGGAAADPIAQESVLGAMAVEPMRKMEVEARKRILATDEKYEVRLDDVEDEVFRGEIVAAGGGWKPEYQEKIRGKPPEPYRPRGSDGVSPRRRPRPKKAVAKKGGGWGRAAAVVGGTLIGGALGYGGVRLVRARRKSA